MNIREERPEDLQGVHRVNELAFESAQEADLVEALRAAGAFTLSLVAGIRWEHEAPDEAFMVLELSPGALRGRRGVVSYRPEFNEV